MNDLGNLLLALCGFGVVCCGSVALALFLLARVTGQAILLPVMAIFEGVLGGGRKDGDQDEIEYRPTPGRRPRRDFQTRKQRSLEQDFDAAVAQYKGSSGKRKRGEPLPPTPESQPGDGFDPINPPDLRGPSIPSDRDTRRGSRDADDDEAFGGFMDDEGDGFPDF